MGDYKNESKNSICNRMSMCLSFLEELENEIRRFAENEHAGLDCAEKNEIEFSMKKISESYDSLSQAHLNFRNLS